MCFRHLSIFCLVAAVLSLQGCSGKNEETPLQVITSDRELVHAVVCIESDPYNVRLWKQICVYLTEKRRFKELSETIYPYYLRFMHDSYGDGTKAAFMLVSVYLAQSFLFMEEYDEVHRCMAAIDAIAYNVPDAVTSDIMVTYHNVSGILAVKEDMDYGKALDHLLKALDYAGEGSDKYNYCSLLCNIASIYCELNDTTGRRYADMAYSTAVTLGDKSSLCYSSVLKAEMLLLSAEYDSALVYACKAKDIARIYGEGYYPISDMLYGDIYACKEDYGRALEFYSKVFQPGADGANKAEPGLLVESYYKTGEIYVARHVYDSAVVFFRRALELSLETDNIGARGNIYSGLSDAYYGLGENDSSLKYYKRYYKYSDSVALAYKERDFHRLLMDYERSRHNEEMISRELEVQRQRQHLIIMFFILLCLILILVWSISMHRKRDIMYKKLSAQNHIYMKRIGRLMHALEESENKAGSKDLALYGRIRTLMERDRVWSDRDISLEKMAGLLGTNRSYVSRVINRYTGVSFTNYINMRRIEEAKKLVRDSDAPLKSIAMDVGYISISSFSKAFYKITGCPPSKYREIVKQQNNDSMI